MADNNPFADPNFGASLVPQNPFSDPNFGSVKPRGLGGMVLGGAKSAAAELARGASILAGKALPDSAAGWMNRNVTAPLGEYAQGQAPREGTESGTASQVAFGLGSFLPTMAAAALAPEVEVPAALTKAAPFIGGAIQRMAKTAVPAALGGVSRGQDLLDQGVDQSTATKAAAISALTGTVMGAVSMGMQGGLLKRAATGAISNIATGEAGRQAQNMVLSDYPNQQSSLTGQGVAVNAITGALLGTILGPRPEKAKISEAIESAQTDVNAGEPVTPPLLGNSPTPMVAYPDGTISRGHAETEAYINTLPENQQVAARAKIYGYGEQTGAIEEAQAADISRRLAEYAQSENQTASSMPLPESQAHARALDLLRDSGEPSTGTAEGDIDRAIELHGNPDGEPAPEVTAQTKNAQVEALWADRTRQQEAAAQTARDADFSKAQVQAGDQQVAQANAVTRAQGFGEREPTAIELALRKAQEKSDAEAPAREKAAADAVEAQRLKDIANPPAKPIEHVTETLKTVLPEAYPNATETAGKAITTKVTNALVKALDGKTLESDQLDAIAKLRDAAPKGGVLESIYGTLHDKLTEGRTKPDETAAEAQAPETIQAEAQGAEKPAIVAPADAGAEPGRAAETNAEVVPQTGKEHLQEAADRLTATLADFTGRVRAGENLSESEQARFKSAQEFAGAIERTKNPNQRPEMDTYLHELATMADDHTTPEGFAEHQQLMSRKADNPEVHSPALEAVINQTGSVPDVLAHLKENGSTQEVRDTAALLGKVGLNTTISSGEMGPGYLKGAVGGYDSDINHATILPGRATEETVLHEITHAATLDRIEQARHTGMPRNQAEAKLVQSYNALEGIRQEALEKASADEHYGLTDAHEFMAELKSNPEFRDFLAKKSLWTRTVDAVRKLLGMPVESKSLLDRALAVQGDFIGKEQFEAAKQAKADFMRFNSSPKGAAEATGNMLSRIAKSADENDKRRFDISAPSMHIAQTVEYIADRVRALPDLVQSGLSRGVDGYLDAHKVLRQASTRAGEAPAKFMEGIRKMAQGMDENAHKDIEYRQAEISQGSSLGGTDPRLNYADNVKAGVDGATVNKSYVDYLHQRYTQLAKSNPEAARLVIEGAKVNRADFVADVATFAKNLIEHKTNQTGDAVAMQAHAPGLDFMDSALRTMRNGDTGKHLDGASYTLDQRIQAAFAAAKTLPEGNALRAQMAALEGMYRTQIDKPYYSVGRQGRFYANVGFKDMDAPTWAKVQDALAGTNRVLGDHTGQDHIYLKFDTSDQAEGVRRKLEAALGDKNVMEKNSSGPSADNANLASRAGISEALRSVLATLHDTIDSNPGLKGPQADMMKEAITRKFLSMLPETSGKLSSITRQGVPGYDGDFSGSFARHASSSVYDLSHIYAAPRFSAAFDQMNRSVEALNHTGTPEMKGKARDVLNEINIRHANSLQPVDNSVGGMLGSFGHTMFLAGAPAFLIRTMTQPWHRGVPHLGSRYGWASTVGEMAGATADALKIFNATIKQGWSDDGLRGVANMGMRFKDLGLSAADEAFMQELHDRGTLKLGMAQQLQKVPLGGMSKMQSLAHTLALTAQYSEMVNRVIVGLSAFRLAQKGQDGVAQKGVAANTDYADRAVSYVMDNFDASNTSRILSKYNPVTGRATPMMTQFMQYQAQTMQQIARTVHDGLFNRDQSAEGVARSSEAKRELGGLFATTAVLSGAMGLPFANAIAGVYNLLTKDEDDPQDIRESMRNSISDIFGVQMGNVIAHGVGAGLGVDTSSMGLQNLLPGSEFLASRGLIKDRLGAQSEALMGPALNGVMNIAKGAAEISDGNYMKGIEAMLPSGVKGYYKAAELATVGYTDSKGLPIGLDATGGDIAWQALGFRPADKALASEAQQYSIEDQAIRQHRAQVIKTEFMKAQGDSEAMQAASESLRRFNMSNPTQPITSHDIAGAYHQHAMEVALARAAGTGVGAVSGKQFARNQSRLGFAAMPQN